MLKVNATDAKMHILHYMKLACAGERIVLCDRNKPVIELIPLEEEAGVQTDRTFGGHRGKVFMTDQFDDYDVEIRQLFESDSPRV